MANKKDSPKPKESTFEYNFIPIDRRTHPVCCSCRKHESCICRPKDGKCVSYEKGEAFVY